MARPMNYQLERPFRFSGSMQSTWGIHTFSPNDAKETVSDSDIEAVFDLVNYSDMESSYGGDDLNDSDDESKSPDDKVPDVETPSKTLSNPLVLMVCVCDKYTNLESLPGNDKDISNIKAMCNSLNYNDINQVDVRYLNRKYMGK